MQCASMQINVTILSEEPIEMRYTITLFNEECIELCVTSFSAFNAKHLYAVRPHYDNLIFLNEWLEAGL